MNESIQDIRGRVQDLLNRAQFDLNLRETLQVNPNDALSAAGVPNTFAKDKDQAATCSWTCEYTCFWTG